MKKFLVALMLFMISLINVSYAENFPVTSPFGWRIHPISGEWKFHAGVDLGFSYGMGIIALFDGQVVSSGDFGDGYGNQVLIYHPAIDAYTRYAHCSELYVMAGTQVLAGQIIATVGSTGYATGPHLHLEYIVNNGDGEYIYVNPLNLWP